MTYDRRIVIETVEDVTIEMARRGKFVRVMVIETDVRQSVLSQWRGLMPRQRVIYESGPHYFGRAGRTPSLRHALANAKMIIADGGQKNAA